MSRSRCLSARKRWKTLHAWAFCAAMLCLSACWTILARAQGDAATPAQGSGGFLSDAQEPETLPTASTGKFLQMLVALLIVLALVVGLAYLLRRVSSRLQQTGGGIVKVIAQLPLGPTQFITIVDIAGEVLVLGVTQHSVTALSEIQDPAILEKLRSEGRGANTLSHLPPFRQWLHRAQHGDGD